MKNLALLLILTGLARPAHAQGLSYDMKTTAERSDPKTGTMSTQVFSAGHGRFSNGNTRIDFTESIMPGGMMAAGSYMIVRKSSPISTFVYPAKREYLELNRDELTKDAADVQKAMGGMAKTEISGVQVDVKDLGAGETIEGNATVKYHVTTDYTMNVTVMGHKSTTAQHSTSDLWVAPGLDGLMNPTARQTGPMTGPMAPLSEAMLKAYARVKPGVVLKTVTTSEAGREGAKHSSTITMQISNIKRTSIDAATFVVPAGYTKTEGLGGAMGAMFGDSLKAAAARARAVRGARP
ncbi:MAG: hypothetical protein ABI647_20675 [Gemmatimonadota bacterium]